MRYWDASALVPLIAGEPRSEAANSLLSEDPRVVTWGWSVVEITSAIERRVRDRQLDRPGRRTALGRLSTLAAEWDEVVDTGRVRHRALQVLARHPLRAADAGHLGAAMVVADLSGTVVPFVCFDSRLGRAAELEGLEVFPPPPD